MDKINKYHRVIEPNLKLIEAWARDGVPEMKMYKQLGVADTTWKKYKDMYPEFKKILQTKKEYVDKVEMVNAFKNMCTGYTVQEKTQHFKYVNGEKILVDEYVKDKYIPGDERAMEKWITLRLKNDELWGGFNDKSINPDEETGGVVFLPPRVELKEPVEVRVTEVVD